MAHRIGSLLALVLVALVPIAATDDADLPVALCTSRSPALPLSVSVPDDLRRHVESMLSMSATFREQCRRLAESPALIRVLMHVHPALSDRSYRARTTFARTPGGGLVAQMQLSLRGDPIEWIAHEFEHVIEQLEGVSLPALAASFRGVWRSTEQMFETQRAIDVGRSVTAEIRLTRRQRAVRDNFVE
jgi:hypothetical protein